MDETRRELTREIRNLEEATKKDYRALLDKVKEPATTNLGSGFGAIIVTLGGMLIANFATQIAGWFS